MIEVTAFSNNGIDSLSSSTLVIVEPPLPMIFASAEEAEINMDYNQNSTVFFEYMNVPDSVATVYMSYYESQPDIVNLTWGEWDGTVAPLMFSGKSIGETDVTVMLHNSETDEVLDSATLHITVKGTIKLSVTQFFDTPSYVFPGIELDMTEGESTYGYLVVTAGTAFDAIYCSADSNSIVEIRWNDEVHETSNQKMFGFDVIPKKSGEERIVFQYVLDGNVVAETYLDMEVYTECAVLQFYDNGSLLMTQDAQPGDVFGEYINIIKHPTTDGQPSFIGWYSAEYGGEKYTDDMTIDDYSVICLYARYDDYVDLTEPSIEPSESMGETKTLMFFLNTDARIQLVGRSVIAESGTYIYEYLPIISQEHAGAFEGWYTAKAGGSKITETDRIETGSYSTFFLYAHWKSVKGDANYDGEITLLDAVMLQKWLLGTGELTCWQNVDLCEDGIVNVLDLCLLKKMLIKRFD